MSAYRVLSHFAVLMLVAAAALPARAEATDDQIQALVVAVTAAGCRVTDDNNAAILQASGLSEEQAHAVVGALLERGQAEIIEGNLKLKTEGCQ